MPLKQVDIGNLPHAMRDKFIAPAWNYKAHSRNFRSAWQVVKNLCNIIRARFNQVWARVRNEQYITNQSIIDAAQHKFTDLTKQLQGTDSSAKASIIQDEPNWLNLASNASTYLESSGAENDAAKVSVLFENFRRQLKKETTPTAQSTAQAVRPAIAQEPSQSSPVIQKASDIDPNIALGTATEQGSLNAIGIVRISDEATARKLYNKFVETAIQKQDIDAVLEVVRAVKTFDQAFAKEVCLKAINISPSWDFRALEELESFDQNAAIEWSEGAANRGDVDSMFRLVEKAKDLETKKFWLHKAIDKGSLSARYALAQVVADEGNREIGMLLLCTAISMDPNPNSEKFLGLIMRIDADFRRKHPGTASLMYEKARSLIPKEFPSNTQVRLALAGNMGLAICYEEGIGTEKNAEKLFEALLEAAKYHKRDPYAYYELAQKNTALNFLMAHAQKYSESGQTEKANQIRQALGETP